MDLLGPGNEDLIVRTSEILVKHLAKYKGSAIGKEGSKKERREILQHGICIVYENHSHLTLNVIQEEAGKYKINYLS